MRRFALRIHRNVNTGLALIFVAWLNVWTVCRVGPGWPVRTFVAIAAWCAIDFTRSCYQCSMQYAVVFKFDSCAILLSEYTVTMKKWSCIDLPSLNLWNECRVCPGRTARTFLAINCYMVCDWPYSKLLLVLDAVWGCIWFHLIRHFVFQIHHNVNTGLALIFVG